MPIPKLVTRALLAVLLFVYMPGVLQLLILAIAVVWCWLRYKGHPLAVTPVFATRSSTDDNRAHRTGGTAHRGMIVAMGADHFEHDKRNSLSYYITLRDPRSGKERTLWGIDLRRVVNETPLSVGDRIALEFLGRQPVVVDQKVCDANGEVVGSRKVNTHRNTWQASLLPA